MLSHYCALDRLLAVTGIGADGKCVSLPLPSHAINFSFPHYDSKPVEQHVIAVAPAMF